MSLSPIEQFFQQVALGENLEQLKNVLNYKDEEDEQKTTLHKASRMGNLKTVQAFILLGAEIEANDKEGNTPLQHAAHNGKTCCKTSY